MFLVIVLVVGVFSGATASVVGFGIGSLLTPLIALQFGTGIAVAAVTLPHALATALRCWRLRAHIDRAVLMRFGMLSAAGALLGAFVYTQLGPTALTRVLGWLLILTAVTQLSGWSSRWTAGGLSIAVFGGLSGFFGGVAGNQGGLRAAALAAFKLTPLAFVATATATGLLVDLARTPVYLWKAGPSLLPLWQPIAVASMGVLIGTLIGERVLLGLSRERFATVVGVAVGTLGVWLALAPASWTSTHSPSLVVPSHLPYNDAMSAPLQCAYCRQRSVVPRWRPFCSERCKMTDLGRWLSGDYRVASAPESESGEPDVEPTSTDRDAH